MGEAKEREKRGGKGKVRLRKGIRRKGKGAEENETLTQKRQKRETRIGGGKGGGGEERRRGLRIFSSFVV